MKQQVKGIKRLKNAWRYSLCGFKSTYRNEAAFRQEVWVGVPAIIISWFLPLSLLWSVLLTSSIILVWAFELCNSALEAIVDRVSPGQHSLSAMVKDCGSAAVLCVLLIAGLLWLTALYQAVAY